MRTHGPNPIRLVFCRSSTRVKAALLLALLLSTAALTALSMARLRMRQQTLAMEAQAAALAAENQKLAGDIAILGTEDSIRTIAREELGLVDPDTVVFKP